MKGKSVGHLQTVVSDCGVTSFFVKVNVLVLHPGRCFERCRSGGLVIDSPMGAGLPGTARRANPSSLHNGISNLCYLSLLYPG